MRSRLPVVAAALLSTSALADTACASNSNTSSPPRSQVILAGLNAPVAGSASYESGASDRGYAGFHTGP